MKKFYISFISVFISIILISCNQQEEYSYQINETLENQIEDYIETIPVKELETIKKLETVIQETILDIKESVQTEIIPEETEINNYMVTDSYENHIMNMTERGLISAIPRFQNLKEGQLAGNTIIIDSGSIVKLNIKDYNRLKFQMCLINQNTSECNTMVINIPGETICRYMEFQPDVIEDYWVWTTNNIPYITIQLVTTDELNGKEIKDSKTQLMIINPQLYRG